MEFKELSGWVSLMVPCYNGERFIERFIKNLAEQTYSKIHLIFVDDGSTDRTYKLFMQFVHLLESKGIPWEYHYQENQGQAAAINLALSKVWGEYCSWLDIDDFITKDHIEKKVNRLMKDEQLGLVICRGVAVAEGDFANMLFELPVRKHLDCLFEDILFDYVGCEPGLYMVRTCLLFKVLPGKSIYPSRVGQNFQLLLPITYYYKAEYIDEILFYYTIREDSHSHSIRTESEWQKRIELVEDVKTNVLNQMIIPNKYLNVLLEALKFKLLRWKMDKITEFIDVNRKSDFAKVVLKECFVNISNIYEKELWIWGETEKNSRLAKLIEEYENVEVKGFIDSNQAKVEKKIYGREVISPERMDKNTMVLLIPLLFHEEIVVLLDRNNFVPRKDYLYPEYEVFRCLKEYKK